MCEPWGGTEEWVRILLVARDTLIAAERSPYLMPQHETTQTEAWEQWAAQWHGRWATELCKRPQDKNATRRTCSGKEAEHLRFAMQLLNVLRARNTFRWLTTKVAESKQQKTDTVAGVMCEQCRWVGINH